MGMGSGTDQDRTVLEQEMVQVKGLGLFACANLVVRPYSPHASYPGSSSLHSQREDWSGQPPSSVDHI